VLIGEIEVDVSGVLGGPDVDRALWAIELGPRSKRSSAERIAAALAASPVAS
jgi:hypothetical protein